MLLLRGYISDPLPVRSGVSQGSILGAVLSLVCNDLTIYVISANILIFADDPHCYKHLQVE